MHQKDIERFAFLFLCGKRDRAILTGKEKMTFSDLNRLIYLTDYLGLNSYGLEIWSEYGGRFKEQFKQLKEIYDETDGIVSWDPVEEDDERQEQWIREFLRQVPDRDSRKRLEKFIAL
ncbi:MAG: hypothetical protein ACLRQR_01580 [Merdimonas faecis]|uniref:hypothetical protein n=1 Tax=Merdimonas faecis TaxID=1653435 RepID=UPI0039905C8A